jgi:very-short-patch-repair endonuclease
MVSAKTTGARTLKRIATLPEKRLWYKLNNRQLCEAKFVRQEPIRIYFVDFCCRQQKLVIEIDGWTHSTLDEIAYDDARSHYLVSLGYRVLRFHNEEVMKNLEGVLETIALHLVE